MLYTNRSSEKFKTEFTQKANQAKSIHIASGYMGHSLVSELTPTLTKVAEQEICRVLIGMVFHKGLNKQQLDSLTKLDDALKNKNPESGVFISMKEYHGKIYAFPMG